MNRMSIALAVTLFSTSLAAAQTAPTQENFDSWSAGVTAANNSPAAAEPGDHQMHWTGPNGKKIQLTVKVPHALATAPTVTLPAVPEDADARPYFDKALAQVRATKAGLLIIPKGTYTFKSLGDGNMGQLQIQGLTDVTIQGNGSTFLFNLNKDGINIRQSKRLALTNFTIEFGLKMAALGTIVTQGDQNVLKIDPAYPVSAADTIGHISEYDPAAKLFVPAGQRVYCPPGSKEVPKFVGDQTYTSSGFQNKNLVGKTYLVFQQWYGGAAIQIKDSVGPSMSEDIIIDNVTINSGPGMGIVAYGVRRGIGIWNSKIVPKPNALISTEYDAIHMLVVGGDVSIHDNVISSQGDDGVNLNNPIHPIAKIEPDGKSLVLATYSRFIQPHDRISAFDETNKYLGSAEVVDTPKPLGGPNNQWNGITLSNAIPGLTLKSLFRDANLVNSRVAVVHNTIENCGCHGVLVQVPNALIADNTFSNTAANAIRLLTNVGFFKEGVGAINVLVRNNRISGSGIDGGLHGLHWAAITAYGTGNAGVTAEPSNRWIDIVGNSITNAQQSCISVGSSETVNVTDNTCTNTNLYAAFHHQASIFVYNSSGVNLKDNHRTGTQTGVIEVDPLTTKDVKSQASY